MKSYLDSRRRGADSFESVRALRNTRRRARGNHNGIIRERKKTGRKELANGGGERKRRGRDSKRERKAGYRLAADSPLHVLLTPPLLWSNSCVLKNCLRSTTRGVSRCERLAPWLSTSGTSPGQREWVAEVYCVCTWLRIRARESRLSRVDSWQIHLWDSKVIGEISSGRKFHFFNEDI